MRIILDFYTIKVLGGLEAIGVALANYLAQQGHDITIFIGDGCQTTPYFNIDKSITIVSYNIGTTAAENKTFKKLILHCNPDVCICLASDPRPLAWCAALVGTGIPFIFSEHSNPSLIEKERWSRAERLAAFAGADGIHVLLDEFMTSIPETMRSRVVIIPNPMLTHIEEKNLVREKVILSLGRWVAVKQVNLLIEAFALLHTEFPQWRLDIWGHGTLEKQLSKTIKQCHLNKKATLRGVALNPVEQYSTASIFCIPSKFEGFGMTAVEAMGCGLPVVGFAGCAGVNSIVRSGKNGLLAEEMTAQSLAHALRSLMRDNLFRQQLGACAKKDARGFAPEHIFPQWEAFISSVSQCKGSTQLHRMLSLKDNENCCLGRLSELVKRENPLVSDNIRLRKFLQALALPLHLRRMFLKLFAR